MLWGTAASQPVVSVLKETSNYYFAVRT